MIWIFRGTKHFLKITRNFLKIFLDKVFLNINLDGTTCIEKFEVPLQFEFGKIWNIEKKINLKLNLSLNLNGRSTVTPGVPHMLTGPECVIDPWWILLNRPKLTDDVALFMPHEPQTWQVVCYMLTGLGVFYQWRIW
jgi:hypothetical protein